MYRLMVAFDPTKATLVDGGRNEGLNFGNVVADSEGIGNGDLGGGGGAERKMECCHCVGDHLRRNCQSALKKKYEKGRRQQVASPRKQQ